MTRHDTFNHCMIDQDDRIIVPPTSIENTVGRNCKPGSSGVVGWFWTHRFTFSRARSSWRVDPLAGLQYAFSRCSGQQRNSGS
jgi:hypothetical protein